MSAWRTEGFSWRGLQTQMVCSKVDSRMLLTAVIIKVIYSKQELVVNEHLNELNSFGLR